jgi:hypothetical protein
MLNTRKKKRERKEEDCRGGPVGQEPGSWCVEVGVWKLVEVSGGWELVGGI